MLCVTIYGLLMRTHEASLNSLLLTEPPYCLGCVVLKYYMTAPNVNKIKQAKIKIGKILFGGAIKENVNCICVWVFIK